MLAAFFFLFFGQIGWGVEKLLVGLILKWSIWLRFKFWSDKWSYASDKTGAVFRIYMPGKFTRDISSLPKVVLALSGANKIPTGTNPAEALHADSRY